MRTSRGVSRQEPVIHPGRFFTQVQFPADRRRPGTGGKDVAEIERDGSFRLDGVPLGSHRLELRKRIDLPSGDRSFLIAALPDVTAGTRDVRFELDLAGEISGTLVGVENGWVLAYPQGSAGGEDRVPAAATQLGARGAFRLTGLAGGLYTLWAIVEDGDKFRYVELNTVARTGDTNVDLRPNR